MAASDPTMDVATPTGTLQGVAAFSWDGTAWQPSGRAGPAVATSTGVLQGVAPFSWSGSAWTPAGRAQPDVATPSGVLDGIAVYTWSGSAWTPTGGTVTPSTPSGALRGVAVFNWDGAAWQPTSQAGPSVATPYGVLAGVAMFGWTGSAWTAGPSLNINFMAPGVLDPRITFTRASIGTYYDATGTVQTATANTPRWDYDPTTLALRGMLVEEARTNNVLNSADVNNASWVKTGISVVAPTTTANQATAPDGTLTAARVVYPAVSTAGNASYCTLLSFVPAASPYSASIWARGNVGGERLYLCATTDGVNYYRTQMLLTTSWQRFTMSTASLLASTWFFLAGTDRRDATQTATSAQTIFLWGGQVEAGAIATSYIPTTAATVTRAQETCIVPIGSWFNPNAYSLLFELDMPVISATYGGICDTNFSNTSYFTDSDWIRVAGVVGLPALTAGVTNKICGSVAPTLVKVSNNGGAAVSAATSGTAQPTATRLALGNDPWSLSTAFNGHMRRAAYWGRELSAVEMQSVTT